MAETLWLPRLTYIVGKQKFIFILEKKPMPRSKVVEILDKIFHPGSQTNLIPGFKRMRT